MPKRKLKAHFRIPQYIHPRNRWRQFIYDAARQEMAEQQVIFQQDDSLAIDVVLYFSDEAIRFHDVDNRLKDVLDALQARLGGPKSVRNLTPLVPNDNQFYRVSVTKGVPPPQSHGAGHVTITSYR